ncbi:MAG: methyl-accepting chemotaxis protein [Burkholderiaceae bacterium]
MSAVAAVDGRAAQDIHQDAVAEIAQGRKRVEAILADIQALSEREIHALGDVLRSILENVRNIVAEADQAAIDSIKRSEATASGFVRDMQEDIQAQEGAVQQVLQLTRGIEKSIEAIGKLTQFSNLLAINARIEAARHGQQGQAFAVIASNMRELSGSIQDVARGVTTNVEALRAGIPALMTRAKSIGARTGSFIEVVAEQVKSASQQVDASGTGRLDTVLNLSNEALSHLQFEDRLNQTLDLVKRDLGVLEERASRVLDGETDLPEVEPLLGEGAPASGAVLMF